MPNTPMDLTGQRFGRWTVVRKSEQQAGGGIRWLCRCDCGNELTILCSRLRSGNTLSCGCLRADKTRERFTKHGGTAGSRTSSEFTIWCHMRNRCTNPKNPSYSNYGGRGIRVCDEWLVSFAAFLAHIGPRPSPRHSIDRINNDGHYEPGNVRWATRAEQSRNQRTCRYITAHGVRLCLADWAARSGIGESTIAIRLQRGWSPERAVSEPVQRSAAR